MFAECPLTNFSISALSFCFAVVDSLLASNDGRVYYASLGQFQEGIIPSSVEELCEGCFYLCESLSRVTFGESSSLKRIGHMSYPP